MRYICLTILFTIGLIGSMNSQAELNDVSFNIIPLNESANTNFKKNESENILQLFATCSLTINSATPSSCSPQTDTYFLEVSVTYSNAPIGKLNINGQAFTPSGTNGTGIFVLSNLPSNGTQNIPVTAFFSNNISCSTFLASAYNAPSSCSVNACSAPDGTSWVKIGSASNSADGPTFSSVVNGSTVVHNDPNQVGRGSVPYIFYIRDGFVNYKEYLDFLNVADPNNTKNLGSGLITQNIFKNGGGVWSIIPTYSNCYQTLSSAQLAKMTVHFVTYNQAAHFCDWKATGNINSGAYTFASATDGNSNITSINNAYTGIRLANEDEFYKAVYWDNVNSIWRLYGTSILDPNGLPFKSGLNTSGVYTVGYGEVYGSTACDFTEKIARQGGQSLGGIYMSVGGFHDFINPRTATFPLTTLAIRPDNEFATEAGMRSSWYSDGAYSASTSYPSPSFRLVSKLRVCSDCSITLTTVKADSATCTNGFANSDAKITISGVTNGAKYSYGTNGVANLYGANATSFSGSTISITGLPNPTLSTTYSIRIFSSDTTCYRDTFATIYRMVCYTPPLILNPCVYAVDRIGGKAFNDYNENGQIDSLEVGQASIVVKIYDQTNALVASTTSDGNGDWYVTNLNFATGNKYRVEFTIPASLSALGIQEALSGSGSKSDIQFITAPICGANYGVNYPKNYCQNNPALMINCYVAGSYNSTGVSDKTIVGLPYVDLGDKDGNINGTTANGAMAFDPPIYTPARPMPTTIATHLQVGSTWGLAYDRSIKKLYAASYIKAGTSLGPGESTGLIYSISDPNNTNGISQFVDLNAIFGAGTAGANPHPSSTTNWTGYNDSTTNTFIGKVGLGAIALTNDFTKLYAMNLYDKMLYEIPTTGALNSLTIKRYPMPTANLPIPATGGTCPVSDVRPFAVSVHPDGSIYVGAVCSGESTSTGIDAVTNPASYNLTAYVWKFSAGSYINVLTEPLRFDRDGNGIYTTYDDPNNTAGTNGLDWEPWSNFAGISTSGNPYQNEPMLTDIAFDEKNDMIVGMRDRLGDCTMYVAGYTSSGGTYKAGKTRTGWAFENNGTCGAITTGGANSNKGPGGGEFFYQDYKGDGVPHSGTGGLLVLSGTRRVVSTTTSPVYLDSNGNQFFAPSAGGAQVYSLLDGKLTGAYALFESRGQNTLQKASGVGDIEPLCATAPIEIGNYVWEDTNGDGVQDASEPPLSGITVKLYNMNINGGSSLIAVTTTAKDGTYYFRDYNEYGSGYDTLTPGKMYFVVIEDSKFNTVTKNLNTNGKNYKLTTQNSTATNADDQNDSDAFISALGKSFDGYAVDTITIPLGANGYVNHTLDFGFVPCPSVSISNAGSSNICVGGNISLNAVLTNFRPDCQLQWQSKTTGGSAWTNINGANGANYTTSPNSSLNYRVTFNCTNNGCCN